MANGAQSYCTPQSLCRGPADFEQTVAHEFERLQSRIKAAHEACIAQLLSIQASKDPPEPIDDGSSPRGPRACEERDMAVGDIDVELSNLTEDKPQAAATINDTYHSQPSMHISFTEEAPDSELKPNMEVGPDMQPVQSLQTSVSQFETDISTMGSIRKTSATGGTNEISTTTQVRRVSDILQGILSVRRDISRGTRKRRGNSNPISQALERIETHPRFKDMITFTILVNTVIITGQTSWRADHIGDTEQPLAFEIFDTACNIVFITELGIRLYLDRIDFFRNRKERSWNVFDFIVVFFAVLEIMVSIFASALTIPGATLLRVLRILRVVRTIRVIRTAAVFRELRMMVSGMMNSAMAFTWLLILMLFVMFVCAVFITHGVTDYKEVLYKSGKDYNSETRFLDDKFGSILKSIYTLFLLISGGQNWGDYNDALWKVSRMSSFVLVMYIAFVTFAILNIVTGIFVDLSIKAADDDSDFKTLEDGEKQKKSIEAFCKVFRDADADGSGHLSLEEFETHVHNPNVQAYFKFIGLDIEFYSPAKIFNLLDFTRGNAIELNEFVSGLSRFRGRARCLDIAALHSDLRLLDRKFTRIIDAVDRNRHDLHTHSSTRKSVRADAMARKSTRVTHAVSRKSACAAAEKATRSTDAVHSASESNGYMTAISAI